MQFDNRAVGKIIRNLRNKKGVSQDVLSGFAGIARTHLTMIENGDKQANFETLWKIANALDMRPSGSSSYTEILVRSRKHAVSYEDFRYNFLQSFIQPKTRPHPTLEIRYNP